MGDISNWKPKGIGIKRYRAQSGGRASLRFGGGRTDLLEELGRVEGEHSNRNRRDEIARVHGELNRGYKDGGRIGLKKGGNGKWIQKATKGMVKTKPCTGKKFGSKTCPPGSRRYNLAKTFKKMGRERKAEG